MAWLCGNSKVAIPRMHDGTAPKCPLCFHLTLSLPNQHWRMKALLKTQDHLTQRFSYLARVLMFPGIKGSQSTCWNEFIAHVCVYVCGERCTRNTVYLCGL